MIGAFAIGFAVAFGAGEAAVPRFPGVKAMRDDLRKSTLPRNSIPALVWEHYDHRLLFHNVRGSMNSAKSADVLIFGHSHAQFGFDQDLARRYFESRGEKVFNLALVYLGCTLPLEMFRKFDLRPKVAIVNADGFFADIGRSEALAYARTSRFEIVKLYFEAVATLAAAHTLHQYLPCWARWNLTMMAVRNRSTGWWEMAYWPTQPEHPIRTDPQPPVLLSPSDPELLRARDFKAEMDRRGVRLVMTLVPRWGPDKREYYRAIAHAIGVPFIEVSDEGMAARDRGNHLTIECARKFTDRFVAAYDAVVPRN